jgi:sugar phosphate isomerase/epimerase
MTLPISVQLYSVREELARDPWGTLEAIAAMGYSAVEPCNVIGGDVDEMAKRIADLGMVVSGYQADMFGDQTVQSMDEAQALDCSRVVHPYSDSEGWKTAEGVQGMIEQCQTAVQKTTAREMTFGYHNHDGELTVIDGTPGLLIAAAAVPEMFFTVDTYWVEVGGQSAVDVVTRLGAQADLLHMKDGPIQNAFECGMVAVGSGKMDFPPIVAAAPSARWLIVELDRCDTDMLTAVKESIDYLETAGLGHKK